MKCLIVLALTLANCFALHSNEIKSRSIVVPAGRPEGRITHGNTAAAKQFPYQVGLDLTDRDTNTGWCGGSLLSNEWVLTAAHCTEDITDAIVILGTTDRQNVKIKYKVTSKNFINHEDYNHVTNENDIALIKIPYTKFSDKIQPVKLPAMGRSYASYVGDKVIASGWGDTSDSGDSSPRHLQWALLNVLPNKVCDRSIDMFSSMLCTATSNGVSTCIGDSGGPLVLESNKVQIGITSFGGVKCLESTPAAFTRLTNFLGWIKKHTRVSY